MAIEPNQIAARYLHAIFAEGVAADLTDRELLERFASRAGEASELAFAALVARHGPMVLHACRASLRDEHDAQDAFQATFLVLVHRARLLWVRESLGPWLHAVALRVAAGARASTALRRSHERRLRRGRIDEPGRGSGRIRRGAEDRAARGGRPAARGLSPGDRALRPRGPDPRGGRATAGLAGRDGQEPAGAGPRPAPRPADPARVRARLRDRGRGPRRRAVRRGRAGVARRCDGPDGGPGLQWAGRGGLALRHGRRPDPGSDPGDARGPVAAGGGRCAPRRRWPRPSEWRSGRAPPCSLRRGNESWPRRRPGRLSTPFGRRTSRPRSGSPTCPRTRWPSWATSAAVMPARSAAWPSARTASCWRPSPTRTRGSGSGTPRTLLPSARWRGIDPR